MKNKKAIGIIVLLLVSISILGCIGSNRQKDIPTEATTPTITQKIQPTETAPNNQLSNDNTNKITCQRPSNNVYGGINRAGNNPPDGTVIDKDLTKYYGRLTATGVCGTYRYISGWWFDEAEMEKLPFKSIMYGESPYVTDEGSDIQEPIAPVPESSTLILTTLGIFTVIMLKKYKQ